MDVCTEGTAPLILAPQPGRWGRAEDIYASARCSDLGSTKGALWWRLREPTQWDHPASAGRYQTMLRRHDADGRVWQHMGHAVMDDFGSLREVRQ